MTKHQHNYSRSLNQVYPRLCLECGKPEPAVRKARDTALSLLLEAIDLLERSDPPKGGRTEQVIKRCRRFLARGKSE